MKDNKTWFTSSHYKVNENLLNDIIKKINKTVLFFIELLFYGSLWNRQICREMGANPSRCRQLL